MAKGFIGHIYTFMSVPVALDLGRTLTATDYGHEEFVVFPWYAVQGTSFNVL
jgi:hypothetical protein